MKNILIYIFVLVSNSLFSQNTYIVDYSNILNEVEEKELNSFLQDGVEKNNFSLHIVVTDSIDKELDSFHYSLKLSNEILLSKSVLNNNAFLYISPSRRETYIHIGHGLEWNLSNEKLNKIIDKIIPYLKKNEYNKAIKLCYTELTKYSSQVSWIVSHNNYHEFLMDKKDINNTIIKVKGKLDEIKKGNEYLLSIKTTHGDVISVKYTMHMMLLLDKLKLEKEKDIYLLVENKEFKLVNVK